MNKNPGPFSGTAPEIRNPDKSINSITGILTIKGDMLMKIYLIGPVLFVAVVALLTAGCTSPPQGNPAPPASPAVASTPVLPSACGFTSCHGLNLACGTNPPRVCPADYEIGDKCRQYAVCSSAGGACTLVTTPQFESCRSCVQRCGGGDPAEILSCEEKC